MKSIKILPRRAKARHRRKPVQRITGYILHETETYVVIVTVKSRNQKTANMVQIWFLVKGDSPIEAVRNGRDAIVCMNCIYRGIRGKKRTCYVNLGKAPGNIYRKYERGGYAFLPVSEYGRVFAGRATRFGAYGEPVLLPLPLVSEIARHSRKRTGYTHQWRNPEYREYRRYLMASCDSMADYAYAVANGWRTFRVRGEHEPILPGEIVCPASEEGGHKSTCERCGLCDGKRSDADARKNIVIIVHGQGKKNFVPLTAIAKAA